jgi:hypothetical protein
MSRVTEVLHHRLATVVAVLCATTGVAAWLLTYQHSERINETTGNGSQYFVVSTSPSWSMPLGVVVLLSGLVVGAILLRRQ